MLLTLISSPQIGPQLTSTHHVSYNCYYIIILSLVIFIVLVIYLVETTFTQQSSKGDHILN